MGDSPSDTPTFVADEATAQTVAPPGGSSSARATTSPARYRDRDSLGRGGMGEVRLCDDTMIGRDVAFKTMLPGSTPESRLRFLHETRLQARLEHPSIVPVYDMGTDAEGNPWFTMRRIGGETLERVLERLAAGDPHHDERHGRRQRLGIFVRVCQAVAYAHRQGVVHRDLKPSNIIVTEDGGVYVLDWGIAKLQEGGAALAPAPTLEAAPMPAPTPAVEASAVTPQTAEGSILGTLGYMPPEQIVAGGAVDARADVYALGATLYELLTLEPLHPRHSPPQLVASTLEGADARASERVPAAEVPPELEAVCVRATATAPGDRYPDVPTMIAAIEAYLDGDRDLAQRRARAQQHAARAEQLASAPSLESRAEAMREAGRALAFDPDSTPALRVITRLLLEPPPAMPEEVVDELQHTDALNARAMARYGTYARLFNLATIPLLLWMGVRSWPLLAALALLSIVSVAGAVRGARHSTGHGVPLRVQVGNAVLLGLLATVAGPFLVVPALATASAAMFVVAGTRNLRLLIGLGCAPMLVPFALEQLSLLPVVTTLATGDALTIQPWMVSLPAVPTFTLLLLGGTTAVALTVLTMANIRDRLTQVRRAQLLQTWHLRRLVPQDHEAGG